MFGFLTVSGCANRPQTLAINAEKQAVEARLRERFPGDTIDAGPIARAYAGYFRRYGGRYPVVHQAKSVLAGRPIESASALVEVMFTAELDSLILTSGHDRRAVRCPLAVDVAVAGDIYTKLSGKDQMLRADDLVVRDADGIIASVAYGPDARTRVRQDSGAAFFGAWCPAGIPAAAAQAHLERLAVLLRLESPEAVIEAAALLSSSASARQTEAFPSDVLAE
jgi:DNA/RNA-binding domain of Phe-tRNA-synthetase-like protein